MKRPVRLKSWMSKAFSAIPKEAGVENEIYYLGSKSRTVAWSDGKPSLNESALTEGLCVRTLENGRQSVTTTRSLDLSNVRFLARQALEMARATPPDPHRSLGGSQKADAAALPIDSNCFREPLDRIHQRFSELEKTTLAFDARVKRVVKFQIYESHISKAIVGSALLPIADESSVTSFSVEILAEESGHTEVAWDFRARRFASEIDWEPMAAAVTAEAVRSLGGGPISSGKYPVVVHPRVGAQLLDLMAHALSAEAVQRGRSFLTGQKSRPVASSLVNLIDDPTLPGGLASGAFDDEGTPHRRLPVVTDGVLRDYFYDLRTASVDGRLSNGHGLKESFSSLPRPASTNFHMQPGDVPVEEMLRSEPRVFLLKEVMGLHMADPITGDFSLGASGALYENGRYSRPVRGVTIAGSVASMLKGVSAVGPDLTWMGATGSPSFLLPAVTIAGN